MMNIDTGMAVVIVAVLIFYLRLIIIQRERVKKVARTLESGGKTTKKGKAQPDEYPRFSILSRNSRYWIIAGLGILAILFGALLNGNILPIAGLHAYWWIPTALGILAFSWAFKS